MADTKYFSYTLKEPGRAIYANVIQASRPTTALEAPTKYSVTLGIGEEDAKALFAMQADAIKAKFGVFTSPDDYQLCCVSGAKAAKKALDSAAIAARGKSPDEALKIKERAETRAELLSPFAGILTMSSRVAFHDRFLDRYTSELSAKERENADRFGFRVAVVVPSQGIVALDTPQAFAEHKDKFYRGAFLGGTVNLSVWERKKADDKDGVAGYIRSLVFVRDGERLASERSLEDEFAHYRGMATDYSPSAAATEMHEF